MLKQIACHRTVYGIPFYRMAYCNGLRYSVR
ncbi:hypothetical protein VPHD51_0200 [Vibrio phage D51]